MSLKNQDILPKQRYYDNIIQLEEVFNPIILKTKDGEEMAICMRDSGFEFKYQGEWYIAKGGYVGPFFLTVND